ncbi:hypothetical protein TIFTF001_018468 [Ficus carica]|uniref:Morc S5 domain-containing protein n=1 Tax=Ficus carica TaxID=3494 RepID=A0AA88AVK0_FICCA|nr:hypothetical protein TIFTF001_018468 [Ficus carica]
MLHHPSVFLKQEIAKPDETPIMINGGGGGGESTASSSDSSGVKSDTNNDAFFNSMANTLKSGFKHDRESDMIGGGEEDEEPGKKKKPRGGEGNLGINTWPLRFHRPLSPSSTSGRTLVLNPEPLSVIPPVISNAPISDKDVAQFGRRSNCKQFWKAGDFDGASDDSSASSSVGMDHVRVHPKFLHSNATSHKWALGAFAELLDNSLDEVCNGATFVNVDMLKNEKDGSKMLLVEDDGGGMNPDKMRQCMSLGYSAKSKLANTIGQYGNGFKTSTMRLGADVIVFSRCPGNNERRPTQSIGMLSYSFLRGTGKEDIVVPIIDYKKRDHQTGWENLTRTSVDDWNRNLATIIQWSPYLSEEDLLQQFNSMKEYGTRIVIYNLWEDDEEQLELDFDVDSHDIQIRGVNRDEKNIQMAKQYPNSRHFLTYPHSLRSYASILYQRLPPGFRIILRGVNVEHHNIENDMMLAKEMTYRPQIQDGISKNPNIFANVKIGFVKDAYAHIDVQGFNVYHKNRLIKPFWRVWNAAGSDGRGVIGVLEANFVEPAHDKQGFERTTVLSRLEARLLAMQKNYWSSNCQKVGYAPRRRSTGSSHTKSSNAEKTMQKDQNGHGNASVGPNTTSYKESDKPSPAVIPGRKKVSNYGTASLRESDQEMFRRLHVKVNLGNGERLGSAYCNANHLIKGQQEKRDLRERSMENGVTTTVNLLTELDREREISKSLETKLREAVQKIQEGNKEQEVLIELLEAERTQRQQEEERLKKNLMNANKTIDELREKVRQLEGTNVSL